MIDNESIISWFGWSAQAKLHWIMPIIGSGIFGFGKFNFTALLSRLRAHLVTELIGMMAIM
jgi:hypothetical protein